jgi:hypothetical protein
MWFPATTQQVLLDSLLVDARSIASGRFVPSGLAIGRWFGCWYYLTDFREPLLRFRQVVRDCRWQRLSGADRGLQAFEIDAALLAASYTRTGSKKAPIGLAAKSGEVRMSSLNFSQSKKLSLCRSMTLPFGVSIVERYGQAMIETERRWESTPNGSRIFTASSRNGSARQKRRIM